MPKLYATALATNILRTRSAQIPGTTYVRATKFCTVAPNIFVGPQ